MKKQWEAPELETLDVKMTFDEGEADAQGKHWPPKSGGWGWPW
ncbi:paeninodin family lasso peptide [Paenibacillus sp. NPDC058174]